MKYIVTYWFENDPHGVVQSITVEAGTAREACAICKVLITGVASNSAFSAIANRVEE